MTAPNDFDPQDEKLDEVLAIVNLLARKSAGGDFIYRGEPEYYGKVSSSLYRKLIGQFQKFSETADVSEIAVDDIQGLILDEAEKFMAHNIETEDVEILSQLQHYGGETNLIDFTTDYLTALFFACDGENDNDCRVILLSKSGRHRDHIVPASDPINRVIAQKSVFVKPPRGFIEHYFVVIIPCNLKKPILKYLRVWHGISVESIYNDLYGFIRVQNLHQQAYARLYAGIVCYETDEYGLAIEHYNKALELNPRMGVAFYNRAFVHYANDDFALAIKDFNEALALIRDDDDIYYNRGTAWLCLSEWEKAKADMAIATTLGANIKDNFYEEYGGVAEFERRHKVELPEDIKEMLS